MFSIYRKFFLALKKIQMANVFSFEKGSNCQNHSSSFHLLIKKSDPPPSKTSDSPPPLRGNSPLPFSVIWKTLQGICSLLYASGHWGLTHDMVFCYYFLLILYPHTDTQHTQRLIGWHTHVNIYNTTCFALTAAIYITLNE